MKKDNSVESSVETMYMQWVYGWLSVNHIDKKNGLVGFSIRFTQVYMLAFISHAHTYVFVVQSSTKIKIKHMETH